MKIKNVYVINPLLLLFIIFYSINQYIVGFESSLKTTNNENMKKFTLFKQIKKRLFHDFLIIYFFYSNLVLDIKVNLLRTRLYRV